MSKKTPGRQTYREGLFWEPLTAVGWRLDENKSGQLHFEGTICRFCSSTSVYQYFALFLTTKPSTCCQTPQITKIYLLEKLLTSAYPTLSKALLLPIGLLTNCRDTLHSPYHPLSQHILTIAVRAVILRLVLYGDMLSTAPPQHILLVRYGYWQKTIDDIHGEHWGYDGVALLGIAVMFVAIFFSGDWNKD